MSCRCPPLPWSQVSRGPLAFRRCTPVGGGASGLLPEGACLGFHTEGKRRGWALGGRLQKQPAPSQSVECFERPWPCGPHPWLRITSLGSVPVDPSPGQPLSLLSALSFCFAKSGFLGYLCLPMQICFGKRMQSFFDVPVNVFLIVFADFSCPPPLTVPLHSDRRFYVSHRHCP